MWYFILHYYLFNLDYVNGYSKILQKVSIPDQYLVQKIKWSVIRLRSTFQNALLQKLLILVLLTATGPEVYVGTIFLLFGQPPCRHRMPLNGGWCYNTRTEDTGTIYSDSLWYLNANYSSWFSSLLLPLLLPPPPLDPHHPLPPLPSALHPGQVPPDPNNLLRPTSPASAPLSHSGPE